MTAGIGEEPSKQTSCQTLFWEKKDCKPNDLTDCATSTFVRLTVPQFIAFWNRICQVNAGKLDHLGMDLTRGNRRPRNLAVQKLRAALSRSSSNCALLLSKDGLSRLFELVCLLHGEDSQLSGGMGVSSVNMPKSTTNQPEEK